LPPTNRTFKRIACEVLDHDPSQDDIRAFFCRFQGALEQRGLALRGITTDGSALYPEPIREVFGNVPHQVCEFHVLKELLKAVLHAVAKVRKELAAKKEHMGRGRPKTKRARRAARRNRRLQQKIADLFEHKNLFVVRTLRQIVEEVYRLFDRRCRMETALAKLAKLRVRVRRFQAVGKTLGKLFSPNLEKALTFLDDKLLPATSNAVEHGNRRHRKMNNAPFPCCSLEK